MGDDDKIKALAFNTSEPTAAPYWRRKSRQGRGTFSSAHQRLQKALAAQGAPESVHCVLDSRSGLRFASDGASEGVFYPSDETPTIIGRDANGVEWLRLDLMVGDPDPDAESMEIRKHAGKVIVWRIKAKR